MKDVHKKRQPRFSITQDDAGWCFEQSGIVGGEQFFCGPYRTRAEAQEAARSLRDNGIHNFGTDGVSTGRKS